MNQEVESKQYATNNQRYNAESIIQMRLDTTRLLSEMEAFLRGTRVIGYQEKEGIVQPVFADIGRPLMNEVGIQWMMGWLQMNFNPQTVQGNKKSEEFETFMVDLHANLACNLMDNLHEYGVKDSDYNAIIDTTMSAADMFFSRTIDNKERESYADTIRSVERVGQERGGIASLMGFKGGMNG